MKHAVFLLISLIRSSALFAQDVPSDSLIYAFINTTISPADRQAYNLEENSAPGFLVSDSSWMQDSLFSKKDRDYFHTQLSRIESFQWQEKSVSSARIITASSIKRIFKHRKTGWDKFRKRYGRCLSHFSMPLFSLDGNYCIVQIGTQCDWLIGGGSVRLYRKVGKEWKFVTDYLTWIS